MSRCLLNSVLIVAVLSNVTTACIDQVIPVPHGVITTEDPVALEIHIVTATSPTQLVEPTQVVVNGNEIFIDIYADGGPIDSPGSLIEVVQLGMMPARTYTFYVTQHETKDCTLHTVTGSFCVQDVNCQDESCQCPEPRQPAYTIIDLGTFGGSTSVALGVNEWGQVVGGADTPQGLRHAYLWHAGVMTDLGTLPPEPQSEALDINNSGAVVGIATVDGFIARGFLWEDGKMIDLGNLGVANTHAIGVNETGQVVGVSWLPPSEPRAFLWERGVMADLGTLGHSSFAWDINSSGQVVGVTTLPEGGQGVAFLWQDGVMTNLGTLGGQSSFARGINDLGQVVGDSERPEGGLIMHAFLWEDGEMTDLGALADFVRSSAAKVNNLGEVIGWGDNLATSQGFLYDRNNALCELRDLIHFQSGWSALSPRDINDQGQIVGSGWHQGPRAFLMTPIDGDFDDDGDTDMADFASFQTCMAGPGEPIGPGCDSRDIDRDGDIDLDDFQAFNWAFTGP